MTILVSLIYMCLRRLTTFVCPASGMNQPPAFVQWAPAAALCAAPTRLTPARSIHAPTPRPRRWPVHPGRPRRQKLSGNSSPFALRPSGVVGPFWACDWCLHM